MNRLCGLKVACRYRHPASQGSSRRLIGTRPPVGKWSSNTFIPREIVAEGGGWTEDQAVEEALKV